MTTGGDRSAHDSDHASPRHPGTAAPVMRSAGSTLIGGALGGLLIISGEFLAAHYLKVQYYGYYAAGMTVARIGEAIATFGLQVAIFHFIPMYRREGRNDLVGGIVIASGLLPPLLGCALALAIWVAAPWLAQWVFHGADVVTYIRLTAFAVPFMALAEILGAITRGFGFAKYYVVVKNLVPPVAFLASVALLDRLNALPLWITGAVVASYALACVAGTGAVARVAGPALRSIRPAFRFGALYGYASGVMSNALLYMVFALTGILAVGVFLGSDSVGIYRVCLQVVVPFDMVLLAFHAAMGPIYPVLAREGRKAELEEAYATAVRWMAVLLVPMGVAIAWNRHELLGLLGPGFEVGSSALLVLAIGYSTCTCFGTIAYVLMLSGRKSVETVNAAIATFTNILLCVILVPRLGLLGAALATAVAFFLLNVLRIWQVRHLIGLRTFRPHFLRIIAASAGASVAAFAVLESAGIAQGPGVVALGLRIALMLAIQAALMWTLGLNRQDKNALKTMLRSGKIEAAPRSGTP